MEQTLKKRLYIALGFLFVLLGFIGAFLPIMPTVPFLLLATYFFSRSSHRFHRWLTTHPRFGEQILDWENHRVIRPKGKVISTVLLSGSVAIFYFLMGDRLWLVALYAGIMISVLAFIWSRRSQPPPGEGANF